MLSRCPTRYENPLSYDILNRMAERIRFAADQLLGNAPDWPLLATLPTGQVNALTMRAPQSDEHVVFFESSLFSFALLLSKAVMRTIPVKRFGDDHWELLWDENAIAGRIDSNEELRYRFFQVIAEYAITGNTGRVEPYLPEGYYSDITSYLCEAVETFVFGHEYAHILAGHLKADNTPLRRLTDSDGILLVYSWPQELEADALGVKLATQAMLNQHPKAHLAQCYMGSDFFFTALDAVEKAALLFRDGVETPKLRSHPPALVRRQALRIRLLEMVGGDIEHFEESSKPSRCLEFAAEHLWAAVHDSVLALRTYGARELPTFKENIAQLNAIWRVSQSHDTAGH